MGYNNLSEEKRTKVARVRTPENIFKLAQEEGYELSD